MQNREHHLHDLACQYLCSKADAIANHALDQSGAHSLKDGVAVWLKKFAKYQIHDLKFNTGSILLEAGPPVLPVDITAETEIPVGRKFTDVLVSLESAFHAYINESGASDRQEYLYQRYLAQCYLEVKTGTFNLGDTIRQIKSYRDSIESKLRERNRGIGRREAAYKNLLSSFQSWFFVSLDHITECDQKQLAASGIGHIQLGDEFRAFCESAKDTESKPDLLI